MAARAVRALGSLVALGGAAYLLAWGSAAPAAAVRRGEATFDDLVGLAAALAGWLLLGWLVIVVLCTALATVPGALGRAATITARRIAPATARRMAAVALGLSVATGSATACSAGPDDRLASAAHPVAAEAFDPNALPTVGRPGHPEPGGLGLPGATTAAEGSAPALTQAEPTTSSTSPPVGEPVGAPAMLGASAELTAEPSGEHPSDADEVVVHRGDSLWAIAARHLGPGAADADIAAEWPRWYATNRDVIGDDPDVILPGMVLRPPDY